jgi:ferredoxin
MSFAARVVPALCKGHGLCLIEAPGVFDADEEGHTRVALGVMSDELRDMVERAARGCPAGAILMTARTAIS